MDSIDTCVILGCCPKKKGRDKVRKKKKKERTKGRKKKREKERKKNKLVRAKIRPKEGAKIELLREICQILSDLQV